MFMLNCEVTGEVLMVKLALVAPAGTVTLAGMVATVAGAASRKRHDGRAALCSAQGHGAGRGIAPTTLVGLTDTPASTGPAAAPAPSGRLKLVAAVRGGDRDVGVGRGRLGRDRTWNPKNCSVAGATMVVDGTMAGWLLVSVMVGPPARERPLKSICPNVLSPADDRVEAGNLEVSERGYRHGRRRVRRQHDEPGMSGPPVRDQERRDRGVEPEADDVDELNPRHINVAISKRTLVAPVGKPMLPA